MIVDYSTIRPPVSALKAAGITAVGRYIGWDSEPGFASIGKNITRAEARELTGAGIAVFLAFEYQADAAAKGGDQGRADGQLAVRQLAGLGAPALTAVYFAVDFDIPDYAPHLAATPQNALAKLGPVATYFRAIAMLQRPYRVGAYGGYWAVSRLLDAGLISMAWQTVAWSGGRRDPRAALYQLAGTAPLAGADVDVHESTRPDFGQWPPAAAPAPAPNWTETLMNTLPGLAQGASGEDVRTLQGCLGARGHPVTIDGQFGPATRAAVEAFQVSRFLTPDGIVGPLTWGRLLNR